MRFAVASLVALLSATACASARTGIPILDHYPPDVTGTTEIEWYDVHGRTAGELAAEMQFQGPRVAAAETWSPIRWSYHLDQNGIVCPISNARAFVVTRVLLPRWTPPADTEPGLTEKWNQFLDALERHAAARKDIVGAAAEELVKRLNDLNAQCYQVSSAVYQVTSAIQERARSEVENFDANDFVVFGQENAEQASGARARAEPQPPSVRPPPAASASPNATPIAPPEVVQMAAKVATVRARPDTLTLLAGSVLSLNAFTLTAYDSSGAVLGYLPGRYEARLSNCAGLVGGGSEYRLTVPGTCELTLTFPHSAWTRPDSAPSARVIIQVR